jgi:hypothetical protein
MPFLDDLLDVRVAAAERIFSGGRSTTVGASEID